MAEQRKMLVYGEFGRSQRTGLALAANESAFDLVMAASSREATALLQRGDTSVMLVDTRTSDAQNIALESRAEAARSQLPILALTSSLSDLSYEDAFSWGADDVVKFDGSRRLVNTFRALPREAPEAPVASRGTVVVAEADRTRRIVVGRVLRNAGYRVTFAADAEDVARFGASDDVELIIASLDILPEPRAVIEVSRSNGSVASWLLPTPPRRLKDMGRDLRDLEGVAVMDGFAPPENTLFMANELTRGRGQDNRRSQRMLYGTTVAFRVAGRDSDEFGFVYNISEAGLYVRTITPPPEDEVWLELCPPRSERRVRLVGKVAWRRRFGPNQMATVPPGFGVQIVDGAAADLGRWKSGYRSFVGDLGESILPSDMPVS